MNRKARIARCYTEQTLSIEKDVELDKRSSHHLSTVLRTRVGASVQLFNGDGNNYSGEVLATGKKTVVKLDSVSASELESPLNITLVQAIARGDKMDGIVQKATELGVSAIQPVYTNQAIAKLDENREARKRAHWQAIVISACEQCGRCVLPEVNSPLSLKQFFAGVDSLGTNDARWILSPSAKKNSLTKNTFSSTTLLVGPESGFDQEELLASKAAGFTELQLGPRVLRTETAGPAAIAVLQAAFGDFN